MEEPEHDLEQSFHGGSDICQQLMDRYSKSSAPQHRHLLATAAAMKSLLSAESLPLTPAAYFAAAISATADSLSSPLDASAAGALLSFLAIVLPLVPPLGVETSRAAEAAEVMARLLSRDEDEIGEKGLGAASVRAGIKCLGALLGFCDLEDWGSVKLGFETLMRFSVEKRPKVRRCSQECLERAFKSLGCSAVTKEASKLVMTMLRTYMPWAIELSSLEASSESKNNKSSEPKNVEVLHMLNMLNLIVPFLSLKTREKVLSELSTLMKCQFSPLTRHILKIVETCFETSKIDGVVSVIETILGSFSSYVMVGDKNPADTIMSATTLLKKSLDILHNGKSSSYFRSRDLVFDSVAGLLMSEASIASHASAVLKELIDGHVDSSSLVIVGNQLFEGETKQGTERNAIKSFCTVLEKCLMSSDGKLNEYVLSVISALFLKLGSVSYYCMRDILLKLADAMTLANGNNTYNLENCIGSAVIAMGPEKILIDVPITVNTADLTCSNIWMVPILKTHVVGSSLEYYMQHILRLAKSFREACREVRPVKKKKVTRNLQNHAHSLWALLPSFCRYPTDLYQNFRPLSEILIKFLKKKDALMHEHVAVAIQVLVNQNKDALKKKTDDGESKSFEAGSLVELNHSPTYTKKIATKNMKAMSSCSTALLEALTDLFIDSPPAKRGILKDAIGCLACIADSSVPKKILMSLLERYNLIDKNGEFEKPEAQEEMIDKEEEHSVESVKKDAERWVLMELASSFVGGANEDLIELIYNFIKHSFQVTDDVCHQQAYHTLSRVLEEQAWFCTSRSMELIDLLMGFKPSTDDADTLRSRFSCFHPLVIHLIKIDSEEENSKAFLIINEIVLMLKDAKEEEPRKVAYDILLKISSTLRDIPSSVSDSSETPYEKLISMIMGYLSGASPHVKSGAISALSMLIHSDASIVLSLPDLIPTILALLHNKSNEVIKAALGFVKVVVSSLQARDLQNLLSSIARGVLPWSGVSRNHFKSKVTVVIEILIRKCGISAVESVTPDKYSKFVKSVVESRQNKNYKDTEDGDTETKSEEQPTTARQEKRKRSTSDAENSGPMKNRKRMDNNDFANKRGSRESNISTDAGVGRRSFGARKFSNDKFSRDRSGSSSGGPNRNKFDKGPQRKMNAGPRDGAARKPAGGSKFGDRRKFGRK